MAAALYAFLGVGFRRFSASQAVGAELSDPLDRKSASTEFTASRAVNTVVMAPGSHSRWGSAHGVFPEQSGSLAVAAEPTRNGGFLGPG